MEQAQADVGAISRRLKQQYPSPFMAKDAAVVSLDRHIVGEVRPALLMLFGAVGFLLLIVCVNVANLLMVRLTTRVREISVRVALGAGRLRIVPPILGESLTLAAAGGALGLLLAFWSMDLLRVLLPADLPRIGRYPHRWRRGRFRTGRFRRDRNLVRRAAGVARFRA